MGRYSKTKRKDTSVVFIGEEDNDSEPLIKGANNKKYTNVKKKNGRLPSLPRSKFPSSFVKYLFSQNSILVRLLTSLVPPFGRFSDIPKDFQGSFLSVFLLTATVYWGLVNTNAKKGGSDPTSSNFRIFALIHSLTLTIGYLLLSSGLIWGLTKCTKTFVTFRQIICLIAYSLFGHTLVLMISGTSSGNAWFMSLLFFFGGLASLRICLVLFFRAPSPGRRFAVCTPFVMIHLFYLVYLHVVVNVK